MNRAKRRKAEALARANKIARALPSIIRSKEDRDYKNYLIARAKGSLRPNEHALMVEVILPEDLKRHHELAPLGNRHSQQIVEIIENITRRMNDRNMQTMLCACCDNELTQAPPPMTATYVLMQAVDSSKATISPVCETCALLDCSEILNRFQAYVKKECADLREL